MDPQSRTDDIQDILLAEDKIIHVGENLWLSASLITRARGEVLEVFDCTGLCAVPGFMDGHVYFQGPGQTHKEDILNGARAAATGGFTSVVCMANTTPPIDSEARIVENIRKGGTIGIRVYSASIINQGIQGEALVGMRLMKESGAVAFTGDGRPLNNEALIREAMQEARRLKLPLSFHERDPRFVKGPEVNSGPAVERLSLTGINRQAEIVTVERDCRLAWETGAAIVIQYINTKESVELMRRTKQSGVRVYVEATPHHFSLTDDAMSLYSTNAKMNLPPRGKEDRIAIIQGLADDTIDIIATDRTPHTKVKKDRLFTKAPSGIIGLKTAFALGCVNLVEPDYLTLLQLIQHISTGAAKFYRLDAGMIKEDHPADLTIFDPTQSWAYLVPESKSTNSPWLNKTPRGKVLLTVCAGCVVYEDERLFAGRKLSVSSKKKTL